ncbi:MAG: 50S ribosomal protein L3 [Clostridia bacterium]|nr:50S ribosomal protein L3 [Clostridia bacterium]
MKKAILGTKLGMTQLFDEAGKIVPVTVIEAGPCVVTQKKTTDNDGYDAVQVGFMDKTEKHTNKPEEGHFKKAGVSAKRFLREFKLENAAEMNVGDEIKADVFAAGDKIDVTGTSKGKGYAGAIKRHNFSRLKETHGTGPVHRHAGSMGACSSPSRVFKGKKLPGHMGVDTVTIQNLDVVSVDVEKNLLLVRGAIPGPKGGLVIVKDAVKA